MLKKIILILTLPLVFFSFYGFSFADNSLDGKVNTNLNSNLKSNVTNSPLDNLKDNSDNNYYGVNTTGAKGVKNTIIEISKDIKNLFFVLATIFLLVVTIKLLFAENTEEEFEKYKNGIIWTTIGLLVMQISYFFVVTIFDQGIGGTFTENLLDNIVKPLIKLLETFASIFFLAVAIYTFIRLISAGGDEEKIKNGKNSIIYAILGILLVKVTAKIVETIYGKYRCDLGLFNNECGIEKAGDLSGFSEIFLKFINWFNGFVAIITVLMIIYAGALILFSGGDDEKLKKGKNIIIFAIIGIFILVISYLILTFFIGTGGSNIPVI